MQFFPRKRVVSAYNSVKVAAASQGGFASNAGVDGSGTVFTASVNHFTLWIARHLKNPWCCEGVFYRGGREGRATTCLYI